MKQLLRLSLWLVLPVFLTGCSLKPTSPNTSLSTAKTEAVQSPTNGSVKGSSTVILPSAATLETVTAQAAIDANLKSAEAAAKLWQDNAELVYFSIKTDMRLHFDQAVEVYTFGSQADAYNWWTLTIDRQTGKKVRALIPKEDYLGTNLKPVPYRFWRMNYLFALQLAEKKIGQTVRENRAEGQLTINLAVGEPNQYLWWTIRYEASGSDPFVVLVNPATNEIVDAQGKPILGN